MRTLIKVEQKHIDNGVLGDGKLCPVALAVAETFPGYSAQVHSFSIDIQQGGELLAWVVSAKRCYQFVRRFDDRKQVQPFNFFLDWKPT